MTIPSRFAAFCALRMPSLIAIVPKYLQRVDPLVRQVAHLLPLGCIGFAATNATRLHLKND